MYNRLVILEDELANWQSSTLVHITRVLWAAAGCGLSFGLYYASRYLSIPFVSTLLAVLGDSTPQSNACVAVSASILTFLVCRRLGFYLSQLAVFWAYGRWAGHVPPGFLRCPTGHHGLVAETREHLASHSSMGRELAVAGTVMATFWTVLTMAVPASVWAWLWACILCMALLCVCDLAARTLLGLFTVLVDQGPGTTLVLVIGALGLLRGIWGYNSSGLGLVLVLALGAILQSIGGRSDFLVW